MNVYENHDKNVPLSAVGKRYTYLEGREIVAAD